MASKATANEKIVGKGNGSNASKNLHPKQHKGHQDRGRSQGEFKATAKAAKAQKKKIRGGEEGRRDGRVFGRGERR